MDSLCDKEDEENQGAAQEKHKGCLRLGSCLTFTFLSQLFFGKRTNFLTPSPCGILALMIPLMDLGESQILELEEVTEGSYLDNLHL